jgi:hypothetical protein
VFQVLQEKIIGPREKCSEIAGIQFINTPGRSSQLGPRSLAVASRHRQRFDGWKFAVCF